MSSSPLNHFLDLVGNLALWLLIFQIFRQRMFLKYPAVGCYATGAALSALGETISRYVWGVNWESGLYYVYSECLQTVLLFFALTDLLHHVLEELDLSRYVRGTTLILLCLTAYVSWWKVEEVKDNLTPKFCIELILNLNFIGMVLAIISWWTFMKLKETRARLVHLSLSLGAYFSAQAVAHALITAVPGTIPYLGTVMQIVGVSLPVAWAFTFTVIGEKDRLSPPRIARPAS